jgi:GH25 family lysozyme M1 (1,4-beta-N-acetylmuramidase)
MSGNVPLSPDNWADRFLELVRSGQEALAITEAVEKGQADVNRLTDQVFYARHPELKGRKVRPNEVALSKEWLKIRDALVKPTIAQLKATKRAPASAKATPAALSARGSNAPLVLGLDTYEGDGNKNRDWVRARTEGPISFAIIRATWGVWADTAFPIEWPRIKDAGLVRGAFLFLRFPNPDVDKKFGASPDPIAQANAFTKTVPLSMLNQSDVPPTLDVEFPGGQSKTGMKVQQCLEQVRSVWKVLKNYYKVAPMIYTSERVWREELSNPKAPDLTESPLWLKHYPFKKGPARRDAAVIRSDPPVPVPWGDPTNWWIHQYQGDAIGLPGFAPGNVDMNRFNAMEKGATGDRVKWVQRRLGIAESGTFDGATETALSALQRRIGLAVIPTVDLRTFAHLCWSIP